MTARTVKLDPKLDREIDAIARRRGTTRSIVIREALAAYVRKEGQPLTFLEAAGDLIGCLKGGPPDLSSNPKYMEGYGLPRSQRARGQPPARRRKR
jgi:hypothetical protein